jgi:broad-specificity NMP kinase
VTLQVCLLGIDGSGKSTLSAALPAALAAELNVRAGSAGECFLVSDPDEDHLAPGFHPMGLPLAARFSKWLKRTAKRVVNRRGLYPAAKLAQMLAQDHAAWKIGRKYDAEVMVSDGNVLLSAMGRAGNYLRPASDDVTETRGGPGVEDLHSAFEYILEGTLIPEESRAKLPDLTKARRLSRLLRGLGLHCLWLPDVVMFLDLSPEVAISRIVSRGAKVDRHENEDDLAQAREMYLRTLEAFARHRGEGAVQRIDLDGRSPGDALAAVVEALRPRIQRHQASDVSVRRTLGTTDAKLSGRSLVAKVFNFRYLFGYLLRYWFQSAWREPASVFSRLGRRLLREGYSADVMRVIYERDEGKPGFFDRAFLDYPLHRAVYDRLQILTRTIEPELEKRLAEERELRILTGPSGFAYDLFRPLEAIVSQRPQAAARVRLVAADLDPHGNLEEELTRQAERLGITFEFVRGDMTDNALRARFENFAPYDMALFVGLSSWLPKPQLVRHIRWIREHMREDGVLVTDSFTPRPYAFSGRYVGYKASYYEPDVYRALMDYCGFDGLRASVDSGRDGINHVMVFSPRESRAPARN